MSKTKRHATEPVPQTMAEAEALAEQLNAVRSSTAQAQSKFEAKVARLSAARDQQLAPLIEQAASIEKQLQLYCEARRNELTNGGKKKSASIGLATVSWRSSSSVSIKDEAELKAWLAAQKQSRFKALLKVTTSIDKAAIGKSPSLLEELPGVTQRIKETFRIETRPQDAVRDSSPTAAGS